ncbi:phosphoglycerate mutase-like protein [Hortaea werneckii]|nr:phosphoglycerate mutase-like protein [Hortaea werneckii]KAI6920919.1 phosphoglycerate mutase-like protein [Hortaea werneckii]KAI6954014.1 phosphoglycerate mutase-like protein [Hortaea werneckii]KAI7073661.1 phosphoglycerate mutase-like protein [Hortaea werneckii]KAI7382951.1 phosphoglycerate mutase-like protein [Hortaea werneckii]
MLENIYVVRHGYRSNWVVDPQTGTYSTTVKSPTGIASDPALASYGVQQAVQLGEHLLRVQPPVDLIYSSPFYRCLQTLSPFTDALADRQAKIDLSALETDAQTHGRKVRVNVEPGLGEFYGLARFDHPSPASIEVLNQHFPRLHAEKSPIVVPSKNGESITQLHDRVAYCLSELIKRADADPSGPKTLLICTHAASMIAIGRALTGRMPEDETEEDFRCFTCSFSKFTRRQPGKGVEVDGDWGQEASWDPLEPDEVPDIGWRGGKGVGGGWECEINGDCSFLQGGEERGWNFEMEGQRIANLEQEETEALTMTNGKYATLESEQSVATKEVDPYFPVTKGAHPAHDTAQIVEPANRRHD